MSVCVCMYNLIDTKSFSKIANKIHLENFSVSRSNTFFFHRVFGDIFH